MSYLTNSDGTPMTMPAGTYESFNFNSNSPVPGRSYPLKKGVLHNYLADNTISPYLESAECLEVFSPFCFVEFTTDGLKSWFTFPIIRDEQGKEMVNTGRCLVPGVNDDKEAAHVEYLQRINEFENQLRIDAAMKKDKADQLAAANRRGAVASELKGMRLKAMNDLKKLLKKKTIKEILASKEASSAAAEYNRLDAFLKAL